MSSPPTERFLHGEVASKGLVTGVLRIEHAFVEPTGGAGTDAEERERFEQALEDARQGLTNLIAESDDMGGEILEFQLALIEDPELRDPALAAIAEGRSASAAWQKVIDEQIGDYQSAEDDYFRARAHDLQDLRDRVLRRLGGSETAGQGLPDDTILLSEELAPSHFLEIDWTRCRGAALTGGSTSSHVAILARARGVPLLVGLQMAEPPVEDGVAAVLDAEAGRLILSPSPGTWAEYQKRVRIRAAERAALADFLEAPAITRAGERITVQISVDDPRLLEGLDPAQSDGVGLTRSEFLFYGRDDLPDEETQFTAYRELLRWAGERPVTVRTLDAGGDKPIAGLTPPGESNPFLGQRGLRLSLARPEVFRAQLRALARAAPFGRLRVMLPMVTTPAEFMQASQLFDDVLTELRQDGIGASRPPLGMMVEVPAAALRIADFAADFFSIGSNDLVQYVTATSRDCPAVSDLHDPLNPAVVDLIRRVVDHGRDSGKEVSLCGDMAAEPETLKALLDLGLRNVSVAPAALGTVKAEISRYG